MAIIKDANYWKGAYHKIKIVEVSFLQKKIILRTVIYPNESIRDISVDVEYKIKPSTFIPLMRSKAEPLVNSSEIRKQVESVAKDNNWNKADVDREYTRLNENAIVQKMSELGKIEMDNRISELKEKPVLEIGYNILKTLPEFEGAVDA